MNKIEIIHFGLLKPERGSQYSLRNVEEHSVTAQKTWPFKSAAEKQKYPVT
jgi:hypothetical protein